ncbi:MAG: glutaminase [Microbacteriaceae bacterium]|nr:glutaminase [Microbacteriaceae bacterium]
MAEPTELAERIAALAARAAERLRAAGVAAETIGEYAPPHRRRWWFGTRPARILAVGRGWRLGALVVTDDGRLLAGGETLRARTPPPILGYTSESARERDELRHAAIRGGAAEGETIHWGASPVDPAALDGASAPLAVRDGAPVVRWAPRTPLAAATPLETYLDERTGLLADPPAGA